MLASLRACCLISSNTLRSPLLIVASLDATYANSGEATKESLTISNASRTQSTASFGSEHAARDIVSKRINRAPQSRYPKCLMMQTNDEKIDLMCMNKRNNRVYFLTIQ
jgi:hypothetical protein